MTELVQLPTVESLQNDVYHVYSLCYGKVPERRVHQNFLRRDMHDGPMPLDFNIWVVRNAARTILVDTGFGERRARERGLPISLDPVDALARIGIDPDEITDIVITHLHFDHSGNLSRFKKAKFHIQDEEVAFATGRSMCHAHIRMPFDVEDVVTLVRHTYGERVVFHSGDVELFPGISLHVLPGHTPGLQSVSVNTGRGAVLLASDASHTYANFAARSPYSLIVDVSDTIESYEKMMKLGGSVDHIIPGHDPLVREFYPAILVNGIELQALHEVPSAHDVEMLANVCKR